MTDNQCTAKCLFLFCLLVCFPVSRPSLPLGQGRNRNTSFFHWGHTRSAPRGPDPICCVPLPLYRVGADGLSYCSILAKESAEVAEELIQLKVVRGLMVAVGNVEHVPSQRHGSISLKVSVMVCGGGQCNSLRALEQKGSLHYRLFFF